MYKNVLFIMPLHTSGGPRLKVLEGMSLANAVVSTSVGGESIHVSYRKHPLSVDAPCACAESLTKASRQDCLDAR